MIAPVAAAVAYSRVHVGVHWASDVAAGAALGTGWRAHAAVVAGPAHGRGACPAGRQRAGAPRRRRPADAGQPVLGRPELRPARRRRPGPAARGAPHRAAGRSIERSWRPRSAAAAARWGRIKALGITAATARSAREPRSRSGTACPLWWCRWGRSTTSPATSVSTTCRRSTTPRAPGRPSPWTSGWSRSTRTPVPPTRSCAPGRSSTRRASARTRSSCGCGSTGSRGGASGRRSSRR